MIRPITFITAVMALSSGAWMFVVKHQAEQLDRQIGGVTAKIRASEQRTRVLQAEWALETDPNRLARLSALFLPQLKPMLPAQMVTWSALAARLPPVGAAVPHLPFPPPLPWQLPDAGPADSLIATASPPEPLATQPDAVADARAETPAPVVRAPVVRATADLAIARPVPTPRPHSPPRHEPVPRHRRIASASRFGRPIPLGRSVLAAPRRLQPMGARVMTITAHAATRHAPQEMPPAPQATSVFGGYAASLPPPRPLGSVP